MQASGRTGETVDSGVDDRRIELAALIERFTHEDGTHPTPIGAMSLIRISRPTEPIHAVHKPALCVIAQGSKRVMLAEEVYRYDPARYLVISVDLPVVGQVLEASRARPYLCFRLDLDPGEIGALLVEAGLPAPRGEHADRGLFLGRTSLPLIDAVLRLVRLLEAPRDIPILAPMVIREILYRLLQSEQGGRLQRVAVVDSQAQRVAKAIGWLKRNYAQTLRIEALARDVHMSPSALHHRFKAVTAMSPLQYQKQLRLQEARRMMLGELTDAATAAYRVGYESPSQFSREYSRLFGAPPSRDVARLRGLLGPKPP
jgi:AraC-like DNA-binding protein